MPRAAKATKAIVTAQATQAEAELVDDIKWRLSADLKKAAQTMGPKEARFLVDTFYMSQETRKRADNQVLALTGTNEPHALISWLGGNQERCENAIKLSLYHWAEKHPIGEWLLSIYGVGPVLAAGLLAHLDVTKAKSAAGFWRYAGLDVTSEWLGAEKAKAVVKDFGAIPDMEALTRLIMSISIDPKSPARRPENMLAMARQIADIGQDEWPTKSAFERALAMRPWNAELKTLCFKFADVQTKFSDREECFYGRIMIEQWAKITEQNLRGKFAETAKERASDVGKSTDAWPWYAGCYQPSDVRKLNAEVRAKREARKLLTKEEKKAQPVEREEKPPKGEAGSGVHMLPPAHVRARAYRWCEKLLLSHLFDLMYAHHYKMLPPKPFVFEHLGHTGLIYPPGLQERIDAFVKG